MEVQDNSILSNSYFKIKKKKKTQTQKSSKNPPPPSAQIKKLARYAPPSKQGSTGRFLSLPKRTLLKEWVSQSVPIKVTQDIPTITRRGHYFIKDL